LRRAVAKGQNIYAITAPLACAAVERLLEGKFRVPGANAPGFIFDADEMLASLGADNSTFKMLGTLKANRDHKLTHSHSIVPGGLLVMSYTTRLTPFTSLMMRVAVSPRNFMSNE
jgi:hypothetical protein